MLPSLISPWVGDMYDERHQPRYCMYLLLKVSSQHASRDARSTVSCVFSIEIECGSTNVPYEAAMLGPRALAYSIADGNTCFKITDMRRILQHGARTRVRFLCILQHVRPHRPGTPTTPSEERQGKHCDFSGRPNRWKDKVHHLIWNSSAAHGQNGLRESMPH